MQLAEPDHDVLDPATGLGLAANDERLYRQLLGLFIDHHGGAAVDLGRLASEDDLAGLQRIAHSLRGSAGQIGAPNLQRSAGEVEHVLREATGADLQHLVSLLHLDLVHLLAQVRVYLGHTVH